MQIVEYSTLLLAVIKNFRKSQVPSKEYRAKYHDDGGIGKTYFAVCLKMEDEEGDYPGLESAGFSGINLNGRNVGAVMVAPRDVDIASQSGCRINIYLNSNVQATCGSVLFGSKVKLRDPGVHLHIEDVKMTRNDGSIDRQKEMRLIKIGLCLVCLFNIFLVLVLLLFSWYQ